MPLTGGSFSAGLKRYSLTVVGPAVSWPDSAGCATSLGSIFTCGPSPPPGAERLGSDQVAAINCKSNQRQHDDRHGDIEPRFRLFGHGPRLRSKVGEQGFLSVISSGEVVLSRQSNAPIAPIQ